MQLESIYMKTVQIDLESVPLFCSHRHRQLWQRSRSSLQNMGEP